MAEESRLSEQEPLTRLKHEFSLAPGPVKPLRPPATRALVLAAAFLALMAGVPAVLGPRADVAPPDFRAYVAYSLLEVAGAYLLVVAGLRLSIPARAPAPSMVLAAIGLAWCAHLAAGWAALAHGVTAPAPAHAWQAGLVCLGAIVLLAAAPVAVGVVLLRRGLPTRRRLAFALIGLAGALAAEAAWRLHCDYSAWQHVLPAHSGAVLLVMVVAAAAASRYAKT
jgi:hypothetical protein